MDADLFQTTFPGCHVVEWAPIVKPLRRVDEAWGILKEHLKATSEPIRFRTVYQEMSMSRQDFRSKIRLNKTFLKMCAGHIQEVLVGNKGSYDAFALVSPNANPSRQASAYDFGFPETV